MFCVNIGDFGKVEDYSENDLFKVSLGNFGKVEDYSENDKVYQNKEFNYSNLFKEDLESLAKCMQNTPINGEKSIKNEKETNDESSNYNKLDFMETNQKTTNKVDNSFRNLDVSKEFIHFTESKSKVKI